MKGSLNPLTHRYHVFRGLLVQPFFWVFFFLMPLLGWFRVDMINFHMVVLNQNYPFEFKYLVWLPVVFYLGVAAIGLVTAIWGRLFCGWSCPHNTLTEWTRSFRAVFGRDKYPNTVLKIFKKLPWLKPVWNLISFPLAIWLTFKLAVILSVYIVPLDWVQAQYASDSPHVALLFGHGLFTLIGLFLLYAGHDFCRTCCPYGMLQAMSAYQEGKWMPMEIQFTGKTIEEDCQTCQACQRICPVDIDPRQPENLKVGVYYGCFNCGECVDACKQVHEHHGEPSILKFRNAWEARRQKAEPALSEQTPQPV